MELHRQAEAFKAEGVALLKEGKIEEACRLLLIAAEKFEKAAEFSEGIAKELRLKEAEWCRRLAEGKELSVSHAAKGIAVGAVREEASEVSVGREAKVEREEKGEFARIKQYLRENLMVRAKEKLPSWNEIGGLEDVKKLLKKAYVIGAIEKKPPAVSSWNAILLYGPPGTGKTMLAAAVARSLDAAFFDVKVSQLLSKYYGETPKIISALFEVAREEAPSVIFIDEFDAIALSRSGDLDEETRRALSTLLAEMDGLSSKSSPFVLVIAATNTPEALDKAILSRFGRKIEIPLPDYEACKEIIRIHTEKKGIPFEDESLYDELARYCVERKMSGRDIKFMCIEAIWNMIEEMNPGLERLAEEPYERIREYELKTRALKKEDFTPH